MERKNFLYLVLLAIAVVFALAYFIFDVNRDVDRLFGLKPTTGVVSVRINVPPPTALPPTASPNVNWHTVNAINNSFQPAVVKIKKGEGVIWVNKMDIPVWPASAAHPSHAAYPEPGGCIGSKFDACGGLKKGETYIFVFNQVGSWKYHDHLNFQTVKPATVEVTE